MGIHLLTDKAASVTDSTVFWPVGVSSEVSFFTYMGDPPTGTTQIGNPETFSLSWMTSSNTNLTTDNTYVEFPAASKWPWTDQTTGIVSWEVDSATTSFNPHSTLGGSPTTTHTVFTASKVSCMDVNSFFASVNNMETISLLNISDRYTTSVVTDQLPSYLASSSDVITDTGPNYAHITSFVSELTIEHTDTHNVDIAAHNFTYGNVSDRQKNYNGLDCWQAFISPQAFRDSTAGYTLAGSNLDYAGSTLDHPYSVSVRENLITPLAKNTTAYEASNSLLYSYSWNLDTAGNGATLLFSKVPASGGIVTSGAGQFSQISTVLGGVQEGGNCVGGYPADGGMESVTRYPAAYLVTSLAVGGASSTYTTILSNRETTVVNGALFIDSVMPAAKTAATLVDYTASFVPPTTTFLRNVDRYHG